jgi:hypothetical protein
LNPIKNKDMLRRKLSRQHHLMLFQGFFFGITY